MTNYLLSLMYTHYISVQKERTYIPVALVPVPGSIIARRILSHPPCAPEIPCMSVFAGEPECEHVDALVVWHGSLLDKPRNMTHTYSCDTVTLSIRIIIFLYDR